MASTVQMSVIIPCYNAADTLSAQLEALAVQEWDELWELLLADNGSTDESLAIAARYQKRIPNLRVVDASGRRGPAFARNSGAAAASAEAIAFIDADDVAAPGWVAAIGNALRRFDFVASRFDKSYLNQEENQKYALSAQSSSLQRLWYPPYALHSGGSGLGVRKVVHEAVGGFDEVLIRLQDTDYCLRIQQTGIQLTFVPEALVYVRNRGTWMGVFSQARSWGKYNTWLYKQYRGDDRIPGAWRKYWSDWSRLARRLVKYGLTSRWIFQLGWQIGLLEGSILCRSDPAVVTNIEDAREVPSTTFPLRSAPPHEYSDSSRT